MDRPSNGDRSLLCVGVRVYYAATGRNDTGTITDIWSPEGPYFVEWDNGDPSDWYSGTALIALLP